MGEKGGGIRSPRPRKKRSEMVRGGDKKGGKKQNAQ